ncbi:hypothetical protein ABK040_011736 [Willaertia magna]
MQTVESNNNNFSTKSANIIDNNKQQTEDEVQKIKEEDEVHLIENEIKQESKKRWHIYITMWGLSFFVHFIMSTNQVFSRYLMHDRKKETNQAIPILSLLFISNFIPFVLYTPRILFKYRNNLKKVVKYTTCWQDFKSVLRTHKKLIFYLTLYQLSLVVGNTLREVATKETSATYVQLIMLTSPFLIYFFGIVFFHTETFSWISLYSALFAAVGATLIILSSSTRQTGGDFHWRWIPDFTKIGHDFIWPEDFIGLLMAFISSILFSLKMISVNKLSPPKNAVEEENKEIEDIMEGLDKKEGRQHHDNNIETTDLEMKEINENKEMKDWSQQQDDYGEKGIVDNESSNIKDDKGSRYVGDEPLTIEEEKPNNHEDNLPFISHSNYNPNIDNNNGTSSKHGSLENNEEKEEEEEETKKDREDKFEVPPEDLFYIQKILLFAWPLIPSLIVDDWSVYGRLSAGKWIVLIAYCLLNKMLASVIEIIVVKELGGGNYATIYPLRIVIGLTLAGVMLGEWIDNIISILGCIIVVLSIAVFSFKKQRERKRKENEEFKEIVQKVIHMRRNQSVISLA